MKRILCFVLIIFVLLLSLCSFVDRNTYDVYSGSLLYVNSSQNVTRLSGDCDFYLISYENLAFVENTHFVMALQSVTGVIRVNGVDYNCRFNTNGELQIEQPYLVNNITRSTWVDYHLICDVCPSSTILTQPLLWFICVLVCVLIVLSVIKIFVR